MEYGFIGKLTAETCLKIMDGGAPEQMPIIQQETANAYLNMGSWTRLGLPAIPEDIRAKAVVYQNQGQ